ncbi:tautomerase family protein [Halomonas coralii]|uniref:2-hydroxymuconate tautomerase n=1 Tax=Modicisalibacter sp. R2A 31.J TaxID=2831898 RepID=UPI001CCDD825|nr:2-hydroxymuconate tautomerase [Modicisalibacter sp. R2A 31.J]MBZ9557327.1 tautomerase family protein [Modicisalibacter sp. R2A 31.J]
MPIISTNLVEGRSNEEKERVIHEVTLACHRAVGTPRETNRIILNDMGRQHYGVGGISKKKSEV